MYICMCVCVCVCERVCVCVCYLYGYCIKPMFQPDCMYRSVARAGLGLGEVWVFWFRVLILMALAY